MKIGIVGAMPQEIDLIKEDFETDTVHEIAGRVYHTGKFCGVDSVLVFSRWGKVAAASTATTLIERFAVDCIIFTGVAGAVSPKLNVGDIVIADKLLQHDFDVSMFGNFEKFEIPLLGISRFPVDARLVEIARVAAEEYLESISPSSARGGGRGVESPAVHVGTIGSGDQFMADTKKIEALRIAIPDLLCVEMEGAAVAQVCHEYGIPYTVIRTISDKADHSAAMDFITFIRDIASHYSHGILKQLVAAMHPSLSV
jgi:adenosylhomocysteine nucleosidase